MKPDDLREYSNKRSQVEAINIVTVQRIVYGYQHIIISISYSINLQLVTPGGM
jgi:hypothetical protein